MQFVFRLFDYEVTLFSSLFLIECLLVVDILVPIKAGCPFMVCRQLSLVSSDLQGCESGTSLLYHWDSFHEPNCRSTFHPHSSSRGFLSTFYMDTERKQVIVSGKDWL